MGGFFGAISHRDCVLDIFFGVDYHTHLGNRRGDMYEIGLWEDSVVESGNDIMFAINIPQESVTIPETMDGIRAAMKMQLTREEGTAKTNEYLKIGRFK